ncbi:hypothetical protein [Alkalibacillus haloalkaliphilus]|uniref:hypothetical protein n=1 Tax=Alkalibacillus haloalkaliphilus TaxID=94136 RepID=UPI0002EE7E51|nr:hypothetical protein [Alkalibacillus haloalkaliphilus]
MQNFYFITLAFVLGIVAFITGEIVTFIMLGFILLSLQNIHRVLKEMLEVQKQSQNVQSS